ERSLADRLTCLPFELAVVEDDRQHADQNRDEQDQRDRAIGRAFAKPAAAVDGAGPGFGRCDCKEDDTRDGGRRAQDQPIEQRRTETLPETGEWSTDSVS